MHIQRSGKDSHLFIYSLDNEFSQFVVAEQEDERDGFDRPT